MKLAGTQGFTLIELSLALVIIGLLVAGTLSGMNLIEASRVRSQINQIEQFQTAANTFKEKYNYLPGDMPKAQAAQFGFVTRLGGPQDGDGDGTIGGCNPSAYSHRFGCETALFWRDLFDAKLINDNVSANTGSWNTINATTGPVNQLPIAKIGNGNFVAIYTGGGPYAGYWRGDIGFNYFYIAGILSAIPANGWNYDMENRISPIQSFALDSKLDDGKPTSGSVQIVWDGLGVGISNPVPYSCYLSAVAYNTSSSAAYKSLCQLSIRAKF